MSNSDMNLSLFYKFKLLVLKELSSNKENNKIKFIEENGQTYLFQYGEDLFMLIYPIELNHNDKHRIGFDVYKGKKPVLNKNINKLDTGDLDNELILSDVLVGELEYASNYILKTMKELNMNPDYRSKVTKEDYLIPSEETQYFKWVKDHQPTEEKTPTRRITEEEKDKLMELAKKCDEANPKGNPNNPNMISIPMECDLRRDSKFSWSLVLPFMIMIPFGICLAFYVNFTS